MRDLVVKHLTSPDRRKKLISSCETTQLKGRRTIIRRHFVYKIIDINDCDLSERPAPEVYVRRICNHFKRQETFFYRLKSSLYAKSNGRVYLILFGHSFKIDLEPIF